MSGLTNKPVNVRDIRRSCKAIFGIVFLLNTGGFLQPAVAQLQVSDQNIGTQESFSNESSILVGPDVTLESTAAASFNAPRVGFAGPVHVVRGATMVVTSMPVSRVDTEDEPGVVPLQFRVEQNFPNPFSTTTRINYALPKSGHVEIRVFNLLGQQICTLHSGSQSAGEHVVTWDGKIDGGARAPGGIYQYQVSVDGKRTSRQMVLLR